MPGPGPSHLIYIPALTKPLFLDLVNAEWAVLFHDSCSSRRCSLKLWQCGGQACGHVTLWGLGGTSCPPAQFPLHETRGNVTCGGLGIIVIINKQKLYYLKKKLVQITEPAVGWGGVSRTLCLDWHWSASWSHFSSSWDYRCKPLHTALFPYFWKLIFKKYSVLLFYFLFLIIGGV
jgi:hypothetical protein